HPFVLFLWPPPASPLFPYTTLFRSVLIRTLHSATEHHTTLQLAGNVLRYQAGIQVRLADFFDVDVHGHTHHVADFATQTVNIFTDRKSTRLNSSHVKISYAVFCLKK